MNEDRLRTALLDMVSDAQAPSGPAIRALAPGRARRTRPVWAIGGAVAACLAVVAAATLARQVPDPVAAEPLTKTYVWGDLEFDYPERWHLDGRGSPESRGPVNWGPHLSARELPGNVLEPGDVTATWFTYASWHTLSTMEGATETAPSGWQTMTEVTDADESCRRAGGTVTMQVYVARDATSRLHSLRACLNSLDPERDQATVKAIAGSLRER